MSVAHIGHLAVVASQEATVRIRERKADSRERNSRFLNFPAAGLEDFWGLVLLEVRKHGIVGLLEEDTLMMIITRGFSLREERWSGGRIPSEAGCLPRGSKDTQSQRASTRPRDPHKRKE